MPETSNSIHQSAFNGKVMNTTSKRQKRHNLTIISVGVEQWTPLQGNAKKCIKLFAVAFEMGVRGIVRRCKPGGWQGKLVFSFEVVFVVLLLEGKTPHSP